MSIQLIYCKALEAVWALLSGCLLDLSRLLVRVWLVLLGRTVFPVIVLHVNYKHVSAIFDSTAKRTLESLFCLVPSENRRLSVRFLLVVLSFVRASGRSADAAEEVHDSLANANVLRVTTALD